MEQGNPTPEPTQKAVHIEWDDLSGVFTVLLSDLLDRPVKAEAEREEYYYWKVTLSEPITQDELELLFEHARASDADRDENLYGEDIPILELAENLCKRLVTRMLTFEPVMTRTDREGVWLIETVL